MEQQAKLAEQVVFTIGPLRGTLAKIEVLANSSVRVSGNGPTYITSLEKIYDTLNHQGGEPVAFFSANAFAWGNRQSERTDKFTREAQPEYGFTLPVYTHPSSEAGWIPVGERLPDIGVRVLGYFGEELGQRECVREHYHPDSPAGRADPSAWHFPWVEPFNNWVTSKMPTHWMPLPQPPAHNEG